MQHTRTMTKIRARMGALTLALMDMGFALPSTQAQEPIPGLADIFQWAVPAAAASTTLFHGTDGMDSGFDVDGLWMFTKTYATSLGLTYVLKNSIHTTRPNGLNDKSFPSGHTASASAGACFVQERYGNNFNVAPVITDDTVGMNLSFRF